MYTRTRLHLLLIAIAVMILSACNASEPPAQQQPAQDTGVIAEPTSLDTGPTAEPTSTTPEWFDIELTDVATGETFSISDFSGKVVLLETMAEWCPNCIVQQHAIRELHESLGYPDDLVSVSLDVDLNEDEESLKAYVEQWGYDWRFAVSPLEVSRALGNLYSAQYLNPPLAPMMIIDRDGSIEHLPYGIKELDVLQSAVEPYFE